MDKQTNINFYTSPQTTPPILSPVFSHVESQTTAIYIYIYLAPSILCPFKRAHFDPPSTPSRDEPGRKLRIIWSSNYATRKRAGKTRRCTRHVFRSPASKADGLGVERERKGEGEGERVKGPAYWQSVTLYDATRANHPISIHISIS